MGFDFSSIAPNNRFFEEIAERQEQARQRATAEQKACIHAAEDFALAVPLSVLYDAALLQEKLALIAQAYLGAEFATLREQAEAAQSRAASLAERVRLLEGALEWIGNSDETLPSVEFLPPAVDFVWLLKNRARAVLSATKEG